MRGDGTVVRGVISLDMVRRLVEAFSPNARHVYLDDRNNIGCGSFELGHVNIKVIELVVFRLLQDNATPVPNGVDAPQVRGGIQGGIRGSGDGEFGDGGGKPTPFEPGRSQRRIRSAAAVE